MTGAFAEGEVIARAAPRRPAPGDSAELIAGARETEELMTIQTGDRIPSATLLKATADGPQPIAPVH